MIAVMPAARRHASRALASFRRSSPRRPRPRAGRVRRSRPACTVSPLVVDLAIRTVDEQPTVRIDRVAAASARLAAGHPPAEAVADLALRDAAGHRLR